MYYIPKPLKRNRKINDVRYILIKVFLATFPDIFDISLENKGYIFLVIFVFNISHIALCTMR